MGKATLPPRLALYPLTCSKRKSPNKAGTIHLIGLPMKPDAKFARPQGTSPLGKGDNEQDKEISIVDMMVADASIQAKSNPSTSSYSKCDGDSEEGSINKEIASARKLLFRMAKTPDDLTVTTTASRPWVWMLKKGEEFDKGDKPPDMDKKRAAKFALGTNFKARLATMTARQTPGKDDSVGFTQDSVVKVRFKIFHEDVQEAVTGMLDHCLAILHKRDKSACFLNGKKTLEAHKATHFPRDITDFYHNWVKWDEPIKSFLNTIPVNKSRFAGSFYFYSEWDPSTLFEKTLLKWQAKRSTRGPSSSS
jgi:hypothetical protein